MSDYELYLGDCLTILPTLAERSTDAVICDPPYGTTACKWDSPIPFAPMWEQLKRLIKPRGAIVLFGSQPFTSALVMSNINQYRYSWIWEKTKPTGFLQVQNQPLKAHEDINVFGGSHYYPQGLKRVHINSGRKNKAARGVYNTIRGQDYIQTVGCYPRSVLRFAIDPKPLHPSSKPLALLEYLVKTYTNEGDTVLDFTMGSGTTGHACANTGRRFIGIEKDAGYFATAQERIATAYAPLRYMEMAV